MTNTLRAIRNLRSVGITPSQILNFLEALEVLRDPSTLPSAEELFRIMSQDGAYEPRQAQAFAGVMLEARRDARQRDC